MDEENPDGSRITLEKNAGSIQFAITCGIGGWMVHTVFASAEKETITIYEQMKVELEKILDLIPLKSDPNLDKKMQLVSKEIEIFVNQFKKN